MKKLSVVMVALCLFTSFMVSAFAIEPFGNPDQTVEDPASLPYSSSFKFKKGSTTDAIEGTSSKISVSINKGKMDRKSARVTITSYYYKESTNVWVKYDSKSVKFTNSEQNFNVDLKIRNGAKFYVRFSKSDYTSIYARGNVSIKAK